MSESEPRFYALRNSGIICNIVLAGTYLVVSAITILLLISLSVQQNTYVASRLGVCGIATAYVILTHVLLRRGHYRQAAYMLVFFYGILAAGIAWTWGVNTPIAPLMFGLVIVLAGILLRARHALMAAVGSGTVLVALQLAITFEWYRPDISWTGSQSSFGDVLGYCVIFGMLALVSWLYNREMEWSLIQAKHAEAALLRQKATLKRQVKQRTAELRQAQLEEMKQMYRFAQMGQLGVTLLHDLANHLTALTLELEVLQNKQQSKDIGRIRQIINYLENIVENTRERLHGDMQKQSFDIIKIIEETVAFVRYKAAKAEVTIKWQPPARSWRFVGDPAYLSQVIAILVSNAIDAYGAAEEHHQTKQQPRFVVVELERTDDDYLIKISDWGVGISKAKRKNLFKPFRSTKKSGLGLGLFIAKQTVEKSFAGTILLNPRDDCVEFTIKLPRGDGT